MTTGLLIGGDGASRSTPTTTAPPEPIARFTQNFQDHLTALPKRSGTE